MNHAKKPIPSAVVQIGLSIASVVEVYGSGLIKLEWQQMTGFTKFSQHVKRSWPARFRQVTKWWLVISQRCRVPCPIDEQKRTTVRYRERQLAWQDGFFKGRAWWPQPILRFCLPTWSQILPPLGYVYTGSGRCHFKLQKDVPALVLIALAAKMPVSLWKWAWWDGRATLGTY